MRTCYQFVECFTADSIPSGISYCNVSYQTLFQAKMFAKDDKKWMLVNIQSHLEFSSQMMNRDTFVDETVITLLRTSFVFWQRGTVQQSSRIYA
jgi:Thioredoxin-like